MVCNIEFDVSGKEMECTVCNLLYVDRTARADGLVARAEDIASFIPKEETDTSLLPFCRHHTSRTSVIGHNLQLLLGTFKGVYVCTSGKSCIAKLADLNQASIIDLVPTLVLVDVPSGDDLDESRLSELQLVVSESEASSSFTSCMPNSTTDNQIEEDIYGLQLLHWMSSKLKYQSYSKLIVPLAMVTSSHADTNLTQSSYFLDVQKLKYVKPEFKTLYKRTDLLRNLNPERTARILDTGAVDVLISPIREEGLSNVAINAYRAQKAALQEHRALVDVNKDRKRSWVGLDDEKPYAYLREAIVSGLMDRICQPGDPEVPTCRPSTTIPSDRKEKICSAIDAWNFSAHQFCDDELMYAALVILQHALLIPDLEPWRMSTEKLFGFLLACRSAYNTFVPYHNFRHVVDVLQACFVFLIRLGRIPPYSNASTFLPPGSSILADSIRPFDALTLLITAIGHDVGHPGVNNAFLVTLDAPLAQLYHERSVLESFHCAAYSQILRRHWPAAFQAVEMRKLTIKTILATDMGLHFDYMKQMSSLQEELRKDSIKECNASLLEERRILACSLLMKCADISNVARTHDVSSQWTMILTDEFARQAAIENDLGIASSLFSPPVREIVELGKSQIEFMKIFAFPLFKGVSELMPAMAFCVEELERNRLAWQEKVSEQQAKKSDEDSVPTERIVFFESADSAESENYSLRQNDQSLVDQKTHLSTLPTKICRTEQTPKNPRYRPEITTDKLLKAQQSQNSLPNDHTTYQSLQIQEQPCSVDLDLPSLIQSSNMRNSDHTEILETSKSAIVNEIELAQTRTDRFSRSENNSSRDTSLIAGDWTSLTPSRKLSLSPTTSPSLTSDSVSEITASPLQALLIRNSNHDLKKCIISHAYDSRAEDSEDENHANRIFAVQKVRTLRKRPSRFRMNFWKRNKGGSQSRVSVGGFCDGGDVGAA